MLQCRNLSLTLGKQEILRDISFQAQPGTITILLGKNGSGKSSLLSCLSGNQTKYTGSVELDGKDVRSMGTTERARALAVMPQVLPLPPVSVAELVCFARHPYTGYTGRLTAKDREIARQALQHTGMYVHENHKVNLLSGGERQLAFFTMMLAQQTPIVLLDEPASSLDTEYRRMVYRFLRDFRNQGKTVIAVMHDLSEAIALADTIGVLHSSHMVFWGTPQAFLSSDVPGDVFGLTPVSVTAQDGSQFTIFRS